MPDAPAASTGNRLRYLTPVVGEGLVPGCGGLGPQRSLVRGLAMGAIK